MCHSYLFGHSDISGLSLLRKNHGSSRYITYITNQPNNQLSNQPIHNLINRTRNQPINPSTHQSINQPAIQSTRRFINLPVNQSIGQSTHQFINLPVNQSIGQSTRQLIGQSTINRLIHQSTICIPMYQPSPLLLRLISYAPAGASAADDCFHRVENIFGFGSIRYEPINDLFVFSSALGSLLSLLLVVVVLLLLVSGVALFLFLLLLLSL